MTHFKKLLILSISCLLLCPIIALGQESIGKEVKPDLEKIAREIMHSRGTCALITLDETGHPRVRMMDPFMPEDDFTIYFGTNPKSRKVKQIAQDKRVTLHYAAEDQSGYVSFYGTAELLNDAETKKTRWKEKWEDFYPDYPDGYMVIKFTPQLMEVVSIPDGVIGDTVTWTPDALKFGKE